jgi:DNA invertase Pin-like site-specific DNA recombinase
MSRSTFATGRPFELRSPLPDAAAPEPAPTPPGLLIGYLPLAAAGAPAAELALRQAGCEVIRRESAGEGPVLAALVAFLTRGDRLVTLNIRCLPSNYGGLHRLLRDLDACGATATFLDNALSTDGEAGQFLRAAARAVAELQPARRPSRPTVATRTRALAMAAAGARPGEIARTLKVSRMTLWRWLRTAQPACAAE